MHGSSRRRDAGAERDVWNSEPDHKSEPLDDGVRKICTVWKLCVASFQSRARAVRAQFRAFSPSFPFFPRWRPGLCFSGSGILCCVLGERERVWKGKKRGFLLFFFWCVVLGKLLWCEDGEEQELQSASQKGEEQEPGTASEGTTH